MVPEHKHQSMYSPHMNPSMVDELAPADCGYMLVRWENDQLDFEHGTGVAYRNTLGEII